MKRPGLTEAMRWDMERLADISDRRFDKLGRAGMATMAIIASDRGDGFRTYRKLTPRGQAALAAPRVTAEELAMLERAERDGFVEPQLLRVYQSCYSKGWLRRGSLMDAGTTALNNVRAASGSADYKEN